MLKRTRALKRVVRQVFPDMEMQEALRYLEMGLLRIPKRLRCGAYARSTGQPCKAQAIPGPYRCKNHGGAPKTEQGRQRIIEGQRRRWAKWREEQRLCSATHDGREAAMRANVSKDAAVLQSG
jgi:hypothetical protein